ncbi:DUF4832 domain-containing protein [Schumannella soli]|uniref:DUF4832 domain-containing protein n=1 Tax=Schumannella soli TaxID=2590779 RepID=A0A506XZH0_9MICO|nr:DUF4832 domain-containing protein [Schumannella soli]TPW74647.1 DUF4832 domain-containing protein [Schumannella soli]
MRSRRIPAAPAVVAVAALVAGGLLAPSAAFAADDASGVPAPAAPSTVKLAASDDVIANPQRGFYHHTETHYRAGGEGWEPLEGAELAGYRAEGITQILRVFYLDAFTATPTLAPDLLEKISADYATARAAGVSVITRFAYVQGGDWPYEPPYGDAPLDVVLAHIHQLGPILRANADVIPVVQEGLIGLWGEGYYTDHFVADPADPGTVTDADWAKRAQVTQALLAELPADRSVQLRTMQMKQKQLGVTTGAAGAVSSAEATTGTALSRVGHHNDCLLAAPDDWGTFLSDPIELDQQYLEADSAWVPVGGETCNVNPPRSEWPSASAELARYHYSYLNRDYQPEVLASWGDAGIQTASKLLGYRLVLTDSTIAPAADGSAAVTVHVRNDGWAAPYTPRPATLVLTAADGAETEIALDGPDIRRWLPGTTTTLTATLSDLAPGDYAAALALRAPVRDEDAVPPTTAARASAVAAAVTAAAPSAAPASDPRFAIRTANVGTWDTATGVNALGQTVVATAAGIVAVPSDPAAVASPGGAAAQLAATGSELASPGALSALIAVVAGALLIAFRRRRRSDAQVPRNQNARFAQSRD